MACSITSCSKKTSNPTVTTTAQAKTGKSCYGFKTDTRSVEKGMEIKPMISGCLIKIFENMDGEKLMEELRDYLSKNAL